VCGLFPESFTNLDNLLRVQLFVRGVTGLEERIHCFIFFFAFGGRRGEGNGGNFVIFFSFLFEGKKGCRVNGLRLSVWLHYFSCG